MKKILNFKTSKLLNFVLLSVLLASVANSQTMYDLYMDNGTMPIYLTSNGWQSGNNGPLYSLNTVSGAVPCTVVGFEGTIGGGGSSGTGSVDYVIVTNIADDACVNKLDRDGDVAGSLTVTNLTTVESINDFGYSNFKAGYNAGDSSHTSNSVFLGGYAGYSADGIDNSYLGYGAGRSAVGDYNSYLGYGAGRSANGNFNSYINFYAGYSAVGDYNSYIGRDAGRYAVGFDNNYLGSYAGRYSISTNNLYLGNYAGEYQTNNNQAYFGRFTTINVNTAKIINVTAGTEPMDAVNVGQLTNALNTANQPVLPLPIGATDLLTVNRNGTNFQANRALVITPQGTHIYTSNTWDCPGGGFYYIHNTNSPVVITIPEAMSYRVNEPFKFIKTLSNGEGGENYPVHVIAGGTSLIGNAKTQTIYKVDQGFEIKNAYDSRYAIQSYVIVQDSRKTTWDDSNSTIVSGSGKVAINFTRSTMLADNMNNLVSITEGATLQNLNDSDGNPTPFDITVVDRFRGNSVGSGYEGTNEFSVEANDSYYYSQMGIVGRETGTVVFTGLDNSKDYIFKTFSSRQSTPRTMQIDSYGTVTNSQVFNCGYNTNVYRYFTNSPINGEISLATMGTGTTTATRNGYLNWVELIYPVDYPYIRKDGTVAMTGNLNMGGNVVSNMADGVADTDGATVGQLTGATNNIEGVDWPTVTNIADNATSECLQESNQVFFTANIGFMYFTDTTGTNGFISTNLWVLGSEQFNALSNALKQAGF